MRSLLTNNLPVRCKEAFMSRRRLFALFSYNFSCSRLLLFLPIFTFLWYFYLLFLPILPNKVLTSDTELLSGGFAKHLVFAIAVSSRPLLFPAIAQWVLDGNMGTLHYPFLTQIFSKYVSRVEIEVCNNTLGCEVSSGLMFVCKYHEKCMSYLSIMYLPMYKRKKKYDFSSVSYPDCMLLNIRVLSCQSSKRIKKGE